jgi:hypothetical protein
MVVCGMSCASSQAKLCSTACGFCVVVYLYLCTVVLSFVCETAEQDLWIAHPLGVRRAHAGCVGVWCASAAVPFVGGWYVQCVHQASWVWFCQTECGESECAVAILTRLQ